MFDKFKPYFPKREWDFILLAVIREFTMDGERLIVPREAKKIYTEELLKRVQKIWTNLGRRFNRIKRSFHDALKQSEMTKKVVHLMLHNL